MPRYHFHIHDGTTITDRAGRELPDLAAAQRVAIRLAGEALEQVDDFWSGHEWRMQVTDAYGLTLFLLDFVGTLAPAALMGQPDIGSKA